MLTMKVYHKLLALTTVVTIWKFSSAFHIPMLSSRTAIVHPTSRSIVVTWAESSNDDGKSEDEDDPIPEKASEIIPEQMPKNQPFFAQQNPPPPPTSSSPIVENKNNNIKKENIRMDNLGKGQQPMKSNYLDRGQLSARQAQSRAPLSRDAVNPRRTMKYTEMMSQVTVQGGGALRTWSFPTSERVQVKMSTEGRPLDSNIELWQGPDNTPQHMKIYIEDGRPFNVVMETPRGPNTVSIRNTAPLEFPLLCSVSDKADDGFAGLIESYDKQHVTIQGGAIRTFPFESIVQSVQILLTTDGRPLNARIELLQGPNNNKMVIELYTEDGESRPFYCVLRTPGSGNVVRIQNTNSVEFPIAASVEHYEIDDGYYPDHDQPVMVGTQW